LALIRARTLCARFSGRRAPTVALTAYASQDDRLHLLRAGFQIHLAKPAQPAELVAAVASLVSAKRPPSRAQP
jgi:CheY-like chemotaxis protein